MSSLVTLPCTSLVAHNFFANINLKRSISPLVFSVSDLLGGFVLTDSEIVYEYTDSVEISKVEGNTFNEKGIVLGSLRGTGLITNSVFNNCGSTETNGGCIAVDQICTDVSIKNCLFIGSIGKEGGSLNIAGIKCISITGCCFVNSTAFKGATMTITSLKRARVHINQSAVYNCINSHGESNIQIEDGKQTIADLNISSCTLDKYAALTIVKPQAIRALRIVISHCNGQTPLFRKEQSDEGESYQNFIFLENSGSEGALAKGPMYGEMSNSVFWENRFIYLFNVEEGGVMTLTSVSFNQPHAEVKLCPLSGIERINLRDPHYDCAFPTLKQEPMNDACPENIKVPVLEVLNKGLLTGFLAKNVHKSGIALIFLVLTGILMFWIHKKQKRLVKTPRAL